MKVKKKGDSAILPSHSVAKVELYKYYLSVYLNIVDYAKNIKNVYLYDLFAGEGIYEDSQEGSPLIAVNVVKEHLEKFKSIPNIYFHFNDSQKSTIEEDKWKIERVQNFCVSRFENPKVEYKFTRREFTELIPKVLSSLYGLKKNERALLFIDPFGYKDITIDFLEKVLNNDKAELLLFLPIDQMYRFAYTVQEKENKGFLPLKKLIDYLFPEKLKQHTSALVFIESLSNRFKSKFPNRWISYFHIEKETNKFYCLMFFSPNKQGHKAMLEAKWKMDNEEGKGYNQNKTTQLFSLKKITYKDKLEEYLTNTEIVTNHDLFEFGLKNDMLPKHTNEILKTFNNEKRLEVISLDKGSNKGNYIGNDKRKVRFILQEKK